MWPSASCECPAQLTAAWPHCCLAVGSPAAPALAPLAGFFEVSCTAFSQHNSSLRVNPGRLHTCGPCHPPLQLRDCQLCAVVPTPSPTTPTLPCLPPPSLPPCSCEIGDGVRLSNCVILNRVIIKNYARVADSIIGWSTKSECGGGSRASVGVAAECGCSQHNWLGTCRCYTSPAPTRCCRCGSCCLISAPILCLPGHAAPPRPCSRQLGAHRQQGGDWGGRLHQGEWVVGWGGVGCQPYVTGWLQLAQRLTCWLCCLPRSHLDLADGICKVPRSNPMCTACLLPV